MDQNQPDWNISELYSKAWEVIKKNKIFWVLGAAAAGSSYNFRSSNNFNSQDFQKLFSSPSHPDTPNQISQVLGASTNKPFTDAIAHLLMSVSISTYILAGIELLTLILLSVAISIVYQAWAQGLLIQAADTALSDQKVTLSEIGFKVLPKLKSLVWLYIIPGLVFFLIIFAAIFVLALAIALTPFPAKIVPIIIAIVAFGAIIYWAVIFAISLIWAPREILLHDQPGKASLIAGYKIAKKKFWPTILLGLVNVILGIIIFIVPLLFLGGLITAGVFAGVKSPSLVPGLIIAAVIIGLPTLIGFSLLTGIIEAFKAVVWTNAYKNIKGKYDH